MKMNNAIVILAALLLLAAGLAYAESAAPTVRDSGFIWYGKYMNANNSQLANLSNVSFAVNTTIGANYFDIGGNRTNNTDLIIRVSNSTGYLNEVARLKGNASSGNATWVFRVIALNTSATPTQTTAVTAGSVFYNTTSMTLDCFYNSAWRYCGNGSVHLA